MQKRRRKIQLNPTESRQIQPNPTKSNQIQPNRTIFKHFFNAKIQPQIAIVEALSLGRGFG
jgi:hypothetical protein